MKADIKFQSTLSVRRATFADEVGEDGGHISIHALREESDPPTDMSFITQSISIHALREESDQL